MTSPVKPPTTGPTGPTDAVSDAGAADSTTEVAATEGAASASAAGRVDALVADLRAGRIDADTAIERLVEHASSTGMARGLSPEMRSELVAYLKSMVENDPTLADLRRDLQRGT
jgi:thioredoxin-like negative regulator of GroEL